MVVVSALLVTACLGSEDGHTSPVNSPSALVPIESNQEISDNEVPQVSHSLISEEAVAAPDSGADVSPESTEFPREDFVFPESPTTVQAESTTVPPTLSTATEATPLQSSKAVEVNARQFRQLLPKDDIAPICTSQFLPPRAADLNPGESVIGVSIDGESKAYRIGSLARREMVNDVIAGVPFWLPGDRFATPVWFMTGESTEKPIHSAIRAHSSCGP